MKIEKIIQIVIAVAVTVALIYFAVNLFNKSAAPYLGGGKGEQVALQDDDEVIITLDDNVYHRVTCDKLRGPTQKSAYGSVIGVNEPCPFCVGQKGEQPAEEGGGE